MKIKSFSRISHPFITELKRIVSIQEPTFRPILTSISELIKTDKSKSKDTEDVRKSQNQLSEVTDMIHTAFTFHGCVGEEKPSVKSNSQISDQKFKAVHRDNVLSLLIGDYLLAQSSLDLAYLRYPKVVGLIAKSIEDYSTGEFRRLQLLEEIESHKLSHLKEELLRFAQLTCGSLLSNACLSIAILAGHPNREPNDITNIGNNVFKFGFHLGSAHRLLDLFYNRHIEHENDFDKRFYARLDKSLFGDDIESHLNDATSVLVNLPKGKKRTNLINLMETMRNRVR